VVGINTADSEGQGQMPASRIEWVEMIVAIIVLPAFLFVATLALGWIGFIVALVISGSSLNALKRIDRLHRRSLASTRP
jgi:hypothetical protein